MIFRVGGPDGRTSRFASYECCCRERCNKCYLSVIGIMIMIMLFLILLLVMIMIGVAVLCICLRLCEWLSTSGA